MESVLLTLAIVLAAALIAWPLLLQRRHRIRAFTARWAMENGFEVVGYREKLLSPFTLSIKSSRSQEVVLLEVMDRRGVEKKCWLKLGGFFTGLWRYQVECRWVD